MQGLSVSGDDQAVLVAKYRDGTKKDLTNTQSGAIILSKPGVNVTPIKVGGYSLNEGSYRVVVANVDSLYADVHRGKGDFIIATYKLNQDIKSEGFGFYTQQSVKQYGTEGQDVVLGAYFDDDGAV